MIAAILILIVLLFVWIAEVELNQNKIQKKIKYMSATQQDIDAAIDALPANIATAVDAALKPVIDALLAKIGTLPTGPTPVDFQPEIDKLNAIGATVAAQVTADLTPATVPPTV